MTKIYLRDEPLPSEEGALSAGIEPAGSESPQVFDAFVRSQADTRAKVIQAVGMKLD